MEINILNFIQNTIRNPFMDIIMKYITYLGDHGIFFISLGVILLILKKTRKTGFTILISLLIGFIIGNLIMKPYFARLRPYEYNSQVILIIDKLSDYSFPSGHTLVAFESAFSIYLNNKKIGIYFFILAFLVSFSRLYLYVHFPSDVIIGAILGSVFAYISYKIVNVLFKNVEYF